MSPVSWPPARPQLLREYARARDFHRHALQLAGRGWYPENVTRRPSALTRTIDSLTLGLFSLLTRAEPTLVVTYAPR